MVKIGIDLGGTKTEIIALSSDNVEIYRHRVPSPQQSYDATLHNIQHLIEHVETRLATRCSIGIGIPGSVSTISGTVKNSNSTWLNGQPFLNDLQALLQRDIKLENDANCLVLSEVVDGAAQHYHNVFGVIIGTGCGGALYLNDRIVIGANGLGGEWGHNPLPYPVCTIESFDQGKEIFDQQSAQPPSSIYRYSGNINYCANELSQLEIPGARCYCGKRGCLETWISGPGFENDYYRATGEKIAAAEIVDKANQGNLDALQALDRYMERLAKSLAQVINIIDPEIIVLGGGMSNIKSLYEELPHRCTKYIFSDQSSTRIVKAQHGDSSGVRGAAFLWEQP